MIRPSESMAIETAGGIFFDSLTVAGARFANTFISAKGLVHFPILALFVAVVSKATAAPSAEVVRIAVSKRISKRRIGPAFSQRSRRPILPSSYEFGTDRTIPFKPLKGDKAPHAVG